MINRRSSMPRGLFVTLGAVMLLGLAACGDDGATGGSTTGGAVDQARIDKAYSGVKGQAPEVTTKPQPGVTLWVVSCGQQSPGCVEPTQATMDAGKAAGWNVTMCDGKLNPGDWGSCVRQGVSAKNKVIITVGIDCPAIVGPLQEAKAAGVVTINNGGLDCDVAGSQKLYSSLTNPLADLTPVQFRQKIGALQADYVIGKTNGTAKVLLVNFQDPLWGPMITEGFKKELATCSGCSIVSQLDIGNQDMISNTLGTKFSSALLQNANANAVVFPVEGFLQAGIGPAIQSSGRSSQLTVVGGFAGVAPNMDVIRDGGPQDADVVYSTSQLSWASVDDAIRLLAGQQPAAAAGTGLRVIDKDNGLPAKAGTGYAGDFDFTGHYKKGWGVS